MRSFLVLIRFPNLLMIAFTQCVMRYAVIFPLTRLHGVELRLSGFDFFWLVFSTACTAAAGYAINDYFDVKTDMINRPDRVVVGRAVSRRKAMMAHVVLCAAGVLTGGYITWRAGIPELAAVYVAAAVMLWLYSSIYKRLFLTGNIIVALFSALVPALVLLEIPLIYRIDGHILLNAGAGLDFAIFWILGVAAFAFFTTLSREIIKDAEDFEGDSAYGCRSLPIVLGDKCAKLTVICINGVIVAMLGLVYVFFMRHAAGRFSFLCILLPIVVSIAFISRKVYKAATADDFRHAGNLMKLVMLAGIACSMTAKFAMM